MQQMMASMVNDVAEKFLSWDIDSVLISSFDVNTENFPPRIESQDHPMIYFFPAYHKHPPYKRFLQEPKLSEIVYYIQKHADIPFEVHVDLRMQEQVKEMQMKQAMEEYERKSSMEMIEAELKKRGEL